MSDSATASGIPPSTRDTSSALREVASWEVVHRPADSRALPERVLAARRALKDLQREMDAQPQTTESAQDASPMLNELRANRRRLRSAIRAMSESPRALSRLPRIVLKGGKEEPRILAVAGIYLQTHQGDWSAQSLCRFVQNLQAYDPLLLDELWNFPTHLQFALAELVLDSALDKAGAVLRGPESAESSKLSALLNGLRDVGHLDWAESVESLIVFDPTLRKDPAQSYTSMDFDSRELYRKRISHVARYSDCTESQVAQVTLTLALAGAQMPSDNPRIHLRRAHVGYYLIDEGFPELASKTGYHPPFAERLRALIRRNADDFYITGIQIAALVCIPALMAMPLAHASALACLIAALLLILPSLQCAVDLANDVVTTIFEPSFLPKLDFMNRIPAECTTLVAVPTLLLNENQVRELINDLEVRFIANRDPHLHYALLTDLPDSVSQPQAQDSHPLVELAVRLISELNIKYDSPRDGAFLLLHRHRIFSVRQGVWMGWERKRGKLLDMNKLLTGEFDAFPIKAGRLQVLPDIRFILTLDSDTQLPRGTAARLIGALAHPLHQAVIHPVTRTVVAGYGILQPRIGVSVQSASRSRMAAIYSGQSGFDIYTRAISDAYQDLYKQGIFTGKGIYEVSTLHAVLDHRFPRNSLLSHDLIEGAYARAGLVTDTELIDDYPSHLNAYNRRKHRWVRGDWQIVQWMFPRVPDESGRFVRSPVSSLSRWQIFDNLRRSLVEPFTFILLMAGWLWLPGGPLYWTIVTLCLLVFPTVAKLVLALGRAAYNGRYDNAIEAFSAFGKSLLVVLLNFVFLPHQTVLCLDAIFRALIRQFITGERLLEWVSAAQAELQVTNRTSLNRRIVFSLIGAGVLALLIYTVHPHGDALWVAAPVLLTWGFADAVSAWLNAPPREQKLRLSAGDESFLLCHSLRIWRYFHQFGEARHNYLIPDNVEEDGLFEAARVSPTNIGLLLNARQAACEFGYLTLPEFASLTERSLATIARLDKYRGHLYNWYNTHTLAPLDASPFVSSVDSGNLVASFYTLHSGSLENAKQPLLGRQLFAGLRVYWQLLTIQNHRHSAPAQLTLPSADAGIPEWIEWLPSAKAVLSTSISSFSNQPDDPWWQSETDCRVDAILTMIAGYLPWLMPRYAPLRAIPELQISEATYALSITTAAEFAKQLRARLAHNTFDNDPTLLSLADDLRASLPKAQESLQTLLVALGSIAQNAERLAAETEFAFLVNPSRHVLSIGYDVHGQKLLEASYDMIASEARIATFLAIAREDLPQRSWNNLSREHAYAFGRFVLLSWSGTMFEYLMPALWMRSYPDTLIARTLVACVQVQRAFARSLHMPWGISESGYAKTDDAGHYQYHAFGVPQIALRTDSSAGPVVSPYSTFLALGVDSIAALGNLHRMAAAGWVGAFGFYEAADFTAEAGKPVLVREWMAHHQGMALLAILNLVRDNVVQRWFHANPLVQSTELLLHELPVAESLLKAHLGN